MINEITEGVMSREYRPRKGSKIMSADVAPDPHMKGFYSNDLEVEDAEIKGPELISQEPSSTLALNMDEIRRPSDDETPGPIDFGVAQPALYYDERDFRNHRQILVGVHIPIRKQPKKHHHHSQRHHHHHRKKRRDTGDFGQNDTEQTSALPTDKVRFILGGEEADHQHKLFTEMDEYLCDADGVKEWKETARWLKFEEDVEEGGDRWSKPHVATLSLYSLFELRSCLIKGTVLLDMNASNLQQIADLILDDLVYTNQMEHENRQSLRDVLMKHHRHQCDKQKRKNKVGLGLRKTSMPMFDLGKKLEGITGSKSVPNNLPEKEKDQPEVTEGQKSQQFPHLPSAVDLVKEDEECDHGNSKDVCIEKSATNPNFMKKIPPGAEACNVLVGELDFLKKPVIAFVRLENALLLGDMTEVPIQTRFLFFMLGPPGAPGRYHEVGRAIATIMTDEIFHEVAYKAHCREDLLAGIDEFLMQVIVLPPGEWDPNIRIEPPDAVQSQEGRLLSGVGGGCNGNGDDEEHDPAGDREEALRRTGRFFGGLKADIYRRGRHYWSDFKDALSPQCIASVIFIYFACLTPIITFGGLMSTKTGNLMGAMEQMLAGAIGGVLFSLFGGQPLIILGATGPMLVFEEILYSFCVSVELDYLPFRFWIGMWTMIFCLILVVTDASSLVRYFTRFTEESFATLIALIFIYEGFKKMFEVLTDNPVPEGYIAPHYCQCCDPNAVSMNSSNLYGNCTLLDYSMRDCVPFGGELRGEACHDNVFFLTVILTLGTFVLAISLKGFRSSSYFPTKVRAVVSDFAVLIAIIVMALVDLIFKVNTPKLKIPLKFEPTASDKRGWLVPPLGKNPAWTIVAASIPAVLATILVFMDQQITALIVNRREHKLKKGAGYHLDLLLVGIIIGICSVLGLPWVVAATVLSVGHVQSLFVESSCTAPGEKPTFLGVREQRVTGVFIFILIGLSVLMTPVLKFIPMPVLFGLFLYMGVSALRGLQFFDRLKIVFIPVKHQPDLVFLRQVPLNRIHLFTAVQFFCLVTLWVIKSTSAALVFPIMVLMLVAVRKLMEKIFTKHELQVLDDLMPETVKKKLEESEAECNSESDSEGCGQDDTDGKKAPDTTDGPTNGQVAINITEEMTKSSLWKSFVPARQSTHGSSKPKSRHKHKHKHRNRHKYRVSNRMKEEEEDDNGLVLALDKRDSDRDSELHRKLSTINENQNQEGVVVDVGAVPDVSVPLLDSGKERGLDGLSSKLRGSRDSLTDKIRDSRDRFLDKLGLRGSRDDLPSNSAEGDPEEDLSGPVTAESSI